MVADVKIWAERWAAARTEKALRALVKDLVIVLRPHVRDAGAEVRLLRLAQFGAGRGRWFSGISGDPHPLTDVQEAVNQSQSGKWEEGARLLARALGRLDRVDDDGMP